MKEMSKYCSKRVTLQRNGQRNQSFHKAVFLLTSYVCIKEKNAAKIDTVK